jgi:hypothetical protein
MKIVKMHVLLFSLFVLVSPCVTAREYGVSQTIYVPADVSTIQAAIDQAGDGDLVLVAPGVYQENIQLSSKTIILASYYHTTGNTDYIRQTIIDGNGGAAVIQVMESVGPETTITGFTIQNGGDGVSSEGEFRFSSNRVIHNGDGIDYEGGGGTCRSNVFEDNQDDGIDLDGPSTVAIEDNLITGNGDDGVEIRLHDYSGPTLEIVLRDNVISNNGEDGIQLIGYPDVSSRVFRIERNLIYGNHMVGLGAMSNGDTVENFEGASILERVYLVNNTFVGNDHGVTDGDNLIALNNIFVDSAHIATKNVDGDSIVSHSLFWGNGIDHQGSNVDTVDIILEDPRLDVNYRLMSGSPAIDAGIAFFVWNSEVVLDLEPSAYSGVAPDLGAFEIHLVFLPFISGGSS